MVDFTRPRWAWLNHRMGEASLAGQWLPGTPPPARAKGPSQPTWFPLAEAGQFIPLIALHVLARRWRTRGG